MNQHLLNAHHKSDVHSGLAKCMHGPPLQDQYEHTRGSSPMHDQLLTATGIGLKQRPNLDQKTTQRPEERVVNMGLDHYELHTHSHVLDNY